MTSTSLKLHLKSIMRLTAITRLPKTFKALVTKEKKVPASLDILEINELPKTSSIKQMSKTVTGECDTIVKVRYSTLNYKDAMVVTGKYPGLKYPMIGGIDLVGDVVETTCSKLKEGDTVIMNSFGIGTDHFGGYSELASLRSDWLLPLQNVGNGFEAKDAARIGTAGLTAMLMVNTITEVGGLSGPIKPSDGPIGVTGATGGVGSVAISILSSLGYDVVAVTGKVDKEADYLKKLGASSVLSRLEFEEDAKPLGKEMFAGCIDTVGGHVLANMLSKMQYNGCAAACGMAGGMGIPGASVAPFILRGVSLFGVDCVFQSLDVRENVYKKYVPYLLKNNMLDVIGGEQIVGLKEVPSLGEMMLKGQTSGRYVVDISKELD